MMVLMNDLFCCFTCRRLDRVTGVRFIDAHQAGLGTRWEVQSNRTVQRETQICDKHSNKKFKLLFSHVTQSDCISVINRWRSGRWETLLLYECREVCLLWKPLGRKEEETPLNNWWTKTNSTDWTLEKNAASVRTTVPGVKMWDVL